MLDAYRKHVEERRALGIPPLPLSPEETAEVCRLLEAPPNGSGPELLALLRDRVSPGVDPSAKVKAEWLARVAVGTSVSPVVSRTEAVFLLGTMLGGYNVAPLVVLPRRSQAGRRSRPGPVQDHPGLRRVRQDRRDGRVQSARRRPSCEAWADGEWFLSRPPAPETMTLTVFRVDGEINTDDFSPAKQASTRPDIPLHALSMGQTRFPGGLQTIAKFRAEGRRVVFVGDVVGTGSSRKSACNSLMWHIGEDIPFVPNKRRGGVVLGGKIAPIFFNTTEDSGGLPIGEVDVTGMKMGDEIVLDLKAGVIRAASGAVLSKIALKPATLLDEFRAGGRLNFIIGRALTNKARGRSRPSRGRFLHQGRESRSRSRARRIPWPRRSSAGPAASTASCPGRPASRR